MGDITRRSFLRASAGVAAITGVGIPSVSSAATKSELVSLIDLSLCDGCVDRDVPVCVKVCHERAAKRIPPPAEPIPELFPRGKIEDWSRKKGVNDRLTPYTQIYIQKAEVENGDSGKKTIFIPRRCMHCDNPACATLCPFSANHKYANGAVVIDADICFGGAKCRDVCPWHIPQRQSGIGIYLAIVPSLAGNGVMYKCDLCYDRLLQKRLPLCMDACPRNAMIIGLRDDIFREAERRASAMKGFIYGAKENGGTGTLYVSPVPFETLNRAIEKGPGRPHLNPVPRRLADAAFLEKSILYAPVIGIGAGIIGALGTVKRRTSGDKEGA